MKIEEIISRLRVMAREVKVSPRVCMAAADLLVDQMKEAKIMKIMLDKGAILPTRAHPWDAGLDLYTPDKCYVPGVEVTYDSFMRAAIPNIRVGCKTIDTGVHVEIPEGYVGFIKSKSGLNVKHGLTGEGVIDAHYTGSIKVKLYNHSAEPHYFDAGDKIAQLVIVPCLLPELEVVDQLEETDRGDGGFGSTGR